MKKIVLFLLLAVGGVCATVKDTAEGIFMLLRAAGVDMSDAGFNISVDDVEKVLTDNPELAHEIEYLMGEMGNQGNVESSVQSAQMLKEFALAGFMGSSFVSGLRSLLYSYGVRNNEIAKKFIMNPLESASHYLFSPISVLCAGLYSYAQFKLWRLSGKQGSAEKLMQKLQTAIGKLLEKIKHQASHSAALSDIDNI